jgi:hypothetical protein
MDGMRILLLHPFTGEGPARLFRTCDNPAVLRRITTEHSTAGIVFSAP